jgi:hypothetical protein
MVLAILEGRKTETRRPLAPQPVSDEVTLATAFVREPFWMWRSPRLEAGYCHTDAEAMSRLAAKATRYQPGTTIWVRETFAVVGYRCKGERHVQGEGSVRYRATWEKAHGSCWRPSIHMPRWAARILLEVVSVRVEQVQEITGRSAMAEGCASSPDWQAFGAVAFQQLWDSLYAGDLAWNKNPWVEVIQHKLVEVRT